MTALLDSEQGIADRFGVPLYPVAEAARYLEVHPSTLSGWARGYVKRRVGAPDVTGDPILTTVPSTGARAPAIPFIGLAEGLVLAAIRRSGVPLQRIRPALRALEDEVGLQHALASTRLHTDGAEILYD